MHGGGQQSCIILPEPLSEEVCEGGTSYLLICGMLQGWVEQQEHQTRLGGPFGPTFTPLQLLSPWLALLSNGSHAAVHSAGCSGWCHARERTPELESVTCQLSLQTASLVVTSVPPPEIEQASAKNLPGTTASLASLVKRDWQQDPVTFLT